MSHDHPEMPGNADTAPVSFAAFVMSLATSAAVHFGDLADPMTGTSQKNIPAAGQMIDLLGILQEKTKGNLDPDEQQLLDQVLYELRLRYVDETAHPRPADGPRIITPDTPRIIVP